ncbi:MAG: DUF4091 domain-containing protein [Candidatus Hydrogenedentes bacterium]|nr:DUF4091 domain-containing protein [Candidatus Hydrogenedentota bacterium]
MRWMRLVGLGAVAAMACALAAAEPAISLSAVPGTVRVRATVPVEGAKAAAIACARNEAESFQVIVRAEGGSLGAVSAEMSPLRREDGAELPAECVTLYREAFVPIRYSAPHATCPPGLVPDPLVPFKHPYSGSPIEMPRWRNNALDGAPFGAVGFDLWEGHQQPLWVDVAVPRDAAPGVYTGTFRVTAKGVSAAEIPVEVRVWNFTLPDGPTHENHFGGVGRVARYLGLAEDSEEFFEIEERYAAMMAAHRINPEIPGHLMPKPGEDGAIVVDDETDRAITEFIERHHVTNIGVPRAPFKDVLGADREKAQNFYRSWYAHLEGKGWAKGAYLYMLDEPNDKDAYERVRQLGAMVAEGEPRLRRLVVEQPYTQKADWGTLDEAIDIWCPLFAFIHEPSVKRVQAQGDAVWSYTALTQRAPGGYYPEYEAVAEADPPYWELDFPVLSYRIAPWLNRRYGITGLLYWSAVYWGSPNRNPWLDPGFRIRWNCEGALFYPGDMAGIDGPVASIRLKNLRDGMEDYEYFALLDARGGGEVVDEVVRTAVPTWGTWDQDPYRLPELRRRLAQAIEELGP